MMVPFFIWFPLLYLGLGTSLVCLLQKTNNAPMPPTCNYNRYDGWQDWERGLTCLFWPFCVVVWALFLMAWLLSSGLGKLVGLICGDTES